MPLSPRAAWALGLGVLGAAALVAPSSAQNEAQKGAAPKPTPALIAYADLDAVIKGYEKVKDVNEKFKADALVKQNDLMKLSADLKKVTEKMQSFQNGSNDFKKAESEFTSLKHQLEAEREKAQHEFAQREAEALAGLYKEIGDTVARVAKHYGYTCVLKISNEPVSGSNPDSVMAGMARGVMYYDPQADITKAVIYNLNRQYELAQGGKPQGAAAPAAERPAEPKRTATGPAAGKAVK